jgi:hypothetical protein
VISLTSCSKETEFNQPNFSIEEEPLNHEFEAKKDSFRLVLTYELQETKAAIEDIDLRLYDFGDEIDNQSKQEYLKLIKELENYYTYLNERSKKIAIQTEQTWETFTLDTKISWNSSRLKMKEIQIELHEKVESGKK